MHSHSVWNEPSCNNISNSVYSPKGPHPESEGFSHELKSVHRTLFTPVCALVPPFQIRLNGLKKKEGFVCILIPYGMRIIVLPPSSPSASNCPLDSCIELFKSLLRIKTKPIRLDGFCFYGGEGGI